MMTRELPRAADYDAIVELAVGPYREGAAQAAAIEYLGSSTNRNVAHDPAVPPDCNVLAHRHATEYIPGGGLQRILADQ
jgi:hypothetical protein